MDGRNWSDPRARNEQQSRTKSHRFLYAAMTVPVQGSSDRS
jgi:hypothetical protein